MLKKPTTPLEPAAERIRYAAALEKGMYVGLVCLLVTFALYVFGVLEPRIPFEELPRQWTKPVHQYLADVDIEPGWSWVSMLRYGDFVNFVGITILASVTLLCYLSIIPLLLKKRDFVFAVLATVEIVVLAAAASGLVAVGH
jgi:hypothetical protein